MRQLSLSLFAIIGVMLLTSLSPAQLLVDDFDYPPGTLSGYSGWTVHSGVSLPIQVTAPGLVFSGYVGSGIGNAVSLTGSGEDIHESFSSQSSGAVYASFMVNVQDASTADSRYFFHLFNSDGGGDDQIARVFVKKELVGSTTFAFGVNKTGTDGVRTGYIYDFNTTYLIVLKYEFIDVAVNDDEIHLWVLTNPPTALEPPPTLTPGFSADPDVPFINRVALRQGDTGTPNVTLQIDGIRVAKTWGDIPLPVQLTAFKATSGRNAITLTWATQSEINNIGFEIMRARSAEGPYEQIGFVEGRFTSNTHTEYAFTDRDVEKNITYWYKLVDLDVRGLRSEHGPVEGRLETDALIRDLALLPNYPNPFNPSTTLSYVIPTSVDGVLPVEVAIFNMVGQRVRTLFNGELAAGSYTMRWDGRSGSGGVLPGGIYFGVLNAGDQQKVIKMSLIK